MNKHSSKTRTCVNMHDQKGWLYTPKGRQPKIILQLLLAIFWVLNACSLPDVPIDDRIETQIPSTTITATSTTLPTEITPSAPTQTPTASTVVSNPTPTSMPTEELNPTPTQDSSIPSDGVEIVESPRFSIQAGTPIGIANFVHLEDGCDWMGIGGQALDQSGIPENDLVAEVGGVLGDVPILELALTGSEVAIGPGGFVVKIADHPVSSDGTVWIQLFNLAGVPQTRKFYLTTYSECERNLILINFSSLYDSSGMKVYLPAVSSEH